MVNVQQSGVYWLTVWRLVFILREAWRQRVVAELLDNLTPWASEVFNDS